jgi:uncharacterized protein
MAEAQTQEPSMEEILASIRRIISEDGTTVESKPAESKPDEAAASPIDDTTVFDLVDEVKDDTAIPSAPVPASVSIDDMSFDAVPAPEPVPVYNEPAPAASLAFDNDRLMSDTAAQASAQALSGLTRMMSGGVNITSQPIGDGHKTLESMVLEMLRPILKDWLDRNLPTMVERIVQKEIQKITRDLG